VALVGERAAVAVINQPQLLCYVTTSVREHASTLSRWPGPMLGRQPGIK